MWDNEKSSQVHLCCGKEVDNVEQKCQICSTKRVNVVENSTQAYFVDIDGYVDEHLQKQLLECTQETNTTQSGICTQDIIVTPENDCCDIVDKDGMMSSMHEKIVTHEMFVYMTIAVQPMKITLLLKTELLRLLVKLT